MLTKPNDIEELLYFSQRDFDEGGEFKAWVFKPTCEKCGAKLGFKGKGSKCPDCGENTLRKKSARSKEFYCNTCETKKNALVCEGCNTGFRKDDLNLQMNIEYTCPHCKEQLEAQIPWKKKGKSIIFKCIKCDGKLTIKQLK